MTYKLVVIINSLKVPKITKILLYEMKFLVPKYNCLQNSWLGGYRLQIPVLSVLNWICWTPPSPPNKIPGHATDILGALDVESLSHINKTLAPFLLKFSKMNILLLLYLLSNVHPFRPWKGTNNTSAARRERNPLHWLRPKIYST